MILESIKLTILGMGVVYFFLIILIYFISVIGPWFGTCSETELLKDDRSMDG